MQWNHCKNIIRKYMKRTILKRDSTLFCFSSEVVSYGIVRMAIKPTRGIEALHSCSTVAVHTLVSFIFCTLFMVI
jgi:hypothetical protein